MWHVFKKALAILLITATPALAEFTCTLTDTTFVAEAIMMDGGVHGFHEEKGAVGSRLMIIQQGGDARLIQQPADRVLTGQCED